MTWPPQSPDLNPIEMVWDELDHRVKEKQPSRRALYRKAYGCGTGCLLTAPHDRQVACLSNSLLSMARSHLPLCSLSLPVDLSNAQCIPAPLATPIPVSDDPSSPVAPVQACPACPTLSPCRSTWRSARDLLLSLNIMYSLPHTSFLLLLCLPEEVQERQECQYGENCTFAYCQEEIYLWTQERKGALRRELLFDPLGSTERRALSVTLLLQQHMGMFMFLCEVGYCFDSKPPIISKCSKENLAVCSNLTARHPFDDKCLVHVVCSANVRHSKVRPLHPLCQFDMSPRGHRYRSTHVFASITHEEMVQKSKRLWYRLEQNAQKQKVTCARHTPELWWGGIGGVGDNLRGGGDGRGLNLKMKFVCGQSDGQVHEPDKALNWTKERWVLLVKSLEKKKWVVVRPLLPCIPTMCVHVMKQKKKGRLDSTVRDMQQMFDMWLRLTSQNRLNDASLMASPLEEKWVSLTTDSTESLVSGLSHRGGGVLR
uniref:Zinc finger CCCH-type containing 7Bb n=1 Tax=Oncorhynchus mykiss TaxID=8022 RepID=A0A8K9V2F0_ONCMY